MTRHDAARLVRNDLVRVVKKPYLYSDVEVGEVFTVVEVWQLRDGSVQVIGKRKSETGFCFLSSEVEKA